MKKSAIPCKKKILVIDPDEDFCLNVRLFLEENYQVIARQELEYIDYTILMNRVDLLLLEAEYAGPDLISLIKDLKTNHKNLKILVMYTYFSADKQTEKELAEYTDALITKPFDVDVLKAKVDHFLMYDSTKVS